MTLLQFMSDRGLTYRALAEQLTVDHAHLHRIVNGRRRCTLGFALRVQTFTDGAVMPIDLQHDALPSQRQAA